jgi:hypothetical protein
MRFVQKNMLFNSIYEGCSATKSSKYFFLDITAGMQIKLVCQALQASKILRVFSEVFPMKATLNRAIQVKSDGARSGLYHV